MKISFYLNSLLGSLGLSDSGILGGVVYECMRCGTQVTVEELSDYRRLNVFAASGSLERLDNLLLSN